MTGWLPPPPPPMAPLPPVPGAPTHADAVTGTGEARVSTAHLRAERVRRRREGRLLVARATKLEQFGELMPDDGLQRGDSLHLISRGHFDTVSIPAWFARNVARLERLTASSLTISRQTVGVLADIDDEGLLGEARIIIQDLTMSRSDNRDNIEAVRRWMQHSVHTLRVAESHAKVLVLEFADAPTVVVEASANLSSNDHRLEQYALHVDEQLAAFHLAWMQEVFDWDRERLPRSWFPSPAPTRALGEGKT